jgi:quercetin dioxygenase-like cupin family protein
MTPSDLHADPVIADLDAAARAPGFATRAAEVVRRLERRLGDAPDTPMTWEEVPLAAFGRPLAPEIASCWVFVLRPGTELPAERHSNSHQRSLSLKGTGRFELRENGRWVGYSITDGVWASAPTGMWHRWFAGSEPLALLSFHTVRAGDLVEEHAARPDDYDGPTEGRRY